MRNNKGRKNQDIINDKIRSKEVRLIDETGENRGVVSTSDALKRAEDNELDLVLISPNSNPPVAKIIDYGKHKFEQQKRKKEQQSNQKKTTTKEVRLSPTIDVGDFDVKMKQARKFLANGDKVQFALRFRGRMITHNEIGREVINRAVDAVSDVSDVEQKAKMDGRRMFAVVAPTKK